MLVFGFSQAKGKFGMVRYRSKKAFSPEPQRLAHAAATSPT